MGEQFSLIYDIVVGALLLGMLLSGMKRGFASAVVGLVAIAAGFVCAMLFSEPIAVGLYDNIAAEPINKAVTSVMDEALDSLTLKGLSDADYSMITVEGVAVEDLQPDFSTANISTYDLSGVDLSKLQLDEEELKKFGFAADVDLSDLNGKIAEFTVTDIDRYGLGRMIVAQVISVNALNAEVFRSFKEFAVEIGEAVPMFFGSMADKIENGDVGAVRSIVLIMMTTGNTAKEAVITGIVEPCFMILVQTLAFVIIFFAVSVILSAVAKALEFVNKIPLVGGLNVVLGGAVGILQGLIAVCVVCIIVRVITTLSGGNVMFFNNTAIQESYVFKYFYDYDFINFLK